MAKRDIANIQYRYCPFAKRSSSPEFFGCLSFLSLLISLKIFRLIELRQAGTFYNIPSLRLKRASLAPIMHRKTGYL